jgi:uncharacterized protein YyaL (SSP411 family)
MANRLAGETSPYLLQHAHNPVDWYPWGREALERARIEDKPIFLSIGYAACHWCHVMERESFEDPATAAQLNAEFVPIKVDREERPDLDQVYMQAVVAMTGGGGWPMSLFLTPDGRPFYGGTYFPGEPRHGMPAFRQVLAAVARAWREQRDDVEVSGTAVAAALSSSAVAPELGASRDGAPTLALLDAAVAALEQSFDALNGGWGGAPKFPQPMTIDFLLHRALDGDVRALAMARRTLDRMADGGIHDQLGGGFHRYATDDVWLVPHFEKMLYDNALLARAYTHAWQLTSDERYGEVARDTLDFVARELTTADGAWASSLDADTRGTEGATYVWTLDEVRDVLGEDEAHLFAEAYDVRPAGNWEGRTILSRVRTDAELAAMVDVAADVVRARLAEDRHRLHAARERRPQPARDDKVLAAWNGLMLASFAEAAVAFGGAADATVRDRAAAYRAVAERAADALVTRLHRPDGRLGRSWKDGRLTGEAVLEDHADLVAGLLSLYEATANEWWFSAARELMDVVLERFGDASGGWFDTADDHEALVARPKDLQDNALPSGNAMATTVLLRLAALTGDGRYRDAAEAALRLAAGPAARYPTGFAQWLVAADLAVAGLLELAVVGDPDDPETVRLVAPALSGFRPRQVRAVGPTPAASAVPLLQARFAINGRPTAFVCRQFSCRQPVNEPEALRALLHWTEPAAFVAP